MPQKETKNAIDTNKIKKGMKVYVPSLEEEATILELPDKKGNVLIQIGVLKMSVHVSKLEETKVKEKEANVKITSMIKSKSAEISTRSFTIFQICKFFYYFICFFFCV